MNLYALASLLTALSSLILGAFVVIRNPRQPVNRAFGLWTFTGFVWSLGYFKTILAVSEPEAVLWWRVSHAGAIFIPAFFIHTVCALLGILERRRALLWTTYCVGLALEGLNLTPCFIVTAVPKLDLPFYLVPGLCYSLFTSYFFICVLYSHYLMFKFYKGLAPFKRNQVKYFLIASIVAFGGGSTTFLLVYDIPFPPVGLFFIPPYSLILAYAIVKHRLMDIKVVIQKSVIYLLISLVVATFFIVSFFLFQRFFSAALNLTTVSYVVLMSLVLALGFQPLLGLTKAAVDRLLFRAKLDVPTAFRKASESIVSVLDFQKLLNYVLEIILNTLEVQFVALYLLNEEGKGYLQVARKDTPESPTAKNVFLPLENRLVQVLKEQKGPLLREDIETLNFGPRRSGLQRTIEETRCALAMPLLFRDELMGILILGQKSSLEIFNALDLELLSAFSNQAIVALENAKLFHQLNVVKTYNENILRSMTSGVITVNTDHQITMVNEGAEKILRRKSQELIHKDTIALGEKLAALVEKSLTDGELWVGQEMEFTSQDPKTQVLSVSTSPLIDTQNEKVGVIAVLNDITRMKELQKQVQQGEKLALIGTMAAGLAHEIKNPLVAVKTFIDLLPSKYHDVEFRENFSQLVKQEVHRINEIVTHLLDFAHPKQPVFAEIHVDEVLHGTLDLLSLQAKDSKVEIRRNVTPDLPPLWADKEQINRVFMNLALNAIQAMHQGGLLEVAAQRKGEFVQIQFRDNGPGIAVENLKKIFDPFFSTKHKGTGLGLTICQKIIQDHRGDIQVNSTPTGTTFTIALPVFKA